jgi:hypothetical protein
MTKEDTESITALDFYFLLYRKFILQLLRAQRSQTTINKLSALSFGIPSVVAAK